MKTALSSPPVDAIDSLRDFSDRLSPIVVKELRQGLRQPAFVILFLFLQSVLAIAVIGSLLGVSSGDLSSRISMGSVISGFVFTLFGLAVFAIQPIRALGSLATEKRDRTIDLLLLTHLSAWRIVFGKWLCFVTQSALLLIAIVPYLMIRYFLGGMNLFAELGGLLVIFMFGATLCAAAVGMSAVNSAILRVIFVIILVIGCFSLSLGATSFYVESLFGGGSGMGTMLGPLSFAAMFVAALLLLTFLTHAFLEFGATRIAPPSENRSARKRLIALLALLVIPALFAISDYQDRFLCFLALMLIGPVAMADSLSENPQFIGPAQRRKGWLLRPGWPSGTFFSMLVLALSLAWVLAMVLLFPSPSDETLGWIMALLNCLLIAAQPVLIIALMRPRENEPANLYLASAFGSIGLGLVILMVIAAANGNEEVCQILFPLFPILSFGLLDDPSSMDFVAVALTTFGYLMWAAIIGHRHWKPQAAAVSSPTDPPA